MYLRHDPGPCPICGAEHTACTADPGPIAIVQLPARDAAVQGGAAGMPSPAAPPGASPAPPPAAPAPALKADAIQATLGPNAFTSAHYRRKRR
jgi:hypothetical protein